MNWKFSALSLCLVLTPLAWAGKTVLPDACGDDKIKFDVKTEKNQPPPAAPEAGKALLVISESSSTNIANCIGCKATTRVGIDGTWVGANHGNSYFSLAITPGEHHMCATWQSISSKIERQNVALATFTAEAGKTYYFEVKSTMSNHGGGKPEFSFELSPLSDDDGKYRVKAWELATSKPK